jgi:NADH-quinone oxidoreductase subunit L
MGAGLLLALAVPAAVWAAPAAQETSSGGGLFGLLPLIIVFPVMGLLINAAWGRALGEKWVGLVASTASALSFVIALVMFFGLRANGYAAQTVRVADWLTLGSLNVEWAFLVDTLSVTMMLVVTGVGTLIHIYAIGYMHEDVRVNGDPGRFPRFFVYLNLFLAAMLILVTGNSYLTMFVGWEGVGLCSYLLIGFWFEKGENNVGNARAGRKAFVVNRIGDWAMLLAMFLIFWTFGSLTFSEVFGTVAAVRLDEHGQAIVTAITLLLLIGATGKSAQIPLYVWLPDAMAGPTPVSALIHAATMVTAGIYMITRSNALFALAPISQTAVAIVGGATALFAATMAVAQFDIKKVLAYSTISQLGFMVAAVGLGGYVAGMFHLVTHAFFKALLFLSAGSVIHAMEHGHHHLQAAAHAHGGGGPDPHAGHDAHPAPQGAHGGKEAKGEHDFDPQDMRNMGGLWARLPVTKWVYLAGLLALAGIPPLAGFWSKDEILLDASLHNQLVYWLLTIAAFLTAFYSGRQMLMVFFGRPRTDAARHAAESPPLMTVPLVILAFLAVFGGALNLPTIGSFSPPGAHALGDWLHHTLAAVPGGDEHAEPEAVTGEGAEGGAAEGEEAAEGSLNFVVAGLSTGLALAGLGLAYGLYRARPAKVTERDPLERLGPVWAGMNRKWWVDEIYDFLVVRPYNWLARVSADVIDWRFWHDWFHDTAIGGTFNTLARFTAEVVDVGGIDFMANSLADLTRGLARRLRGFQSAPSAAQSSAISRPMPRPAPVTMMTLSCSDLAIGVSRLIRSSLPRPACGERSDCIEDAIRVRGLSASPDVEAAPHPGPLPVKNGERGMRDRLSTSRS